MDFIVFFCPVKTQEREKSKSKGKKHTLHPSVSLCLPSFMSYSGLQQVGQGFGFWAKDESVGNTGF